MGRLARCAFSMRSTYRANLGTRGVSPTLASCATSACKGRHERQHGRGRQLGFPTKSCTAAGSDIPRPPRSRCFEFLVSSASICSSATEHGCQSRPPHVISRAIRALMTPKLSGTTPNTPATSRTETKMESSCAARAPALCYVHVEARLGGASTARCAPLRRDSCLVHLRCLMADSRA